MIELGAEADKKTAWSRQQQPSTQIHNYIPHETIVCDNRDPSWINNEIKKLINKKNSAYKSYCRGHEMLSIKMIKLCGNSICKPLSIIFNDCLQEGKFPSDWKKAHVVFAQKKGDK